MAVQCIGEAIEAVAYDPIDALNTGRGEGFDRPVCNSACHDILLKITCMVSIDIVGAVHRTRGEVFGPGARPGLISSGLRGATGLGVERVTVAPFSSPIRGMQLGDGCGP
jgi:hypothetical protein